MPVRAIDLIQGEAWAILPSALETICAIALRENESPEAVAARLGRPLENTRRVEMRGGVAVIPVTGPIFPRANLFTEISGATSVQRLALDFTAALESGEVHDIVLDIDSPGGHVTGINEFAAMIHAARGKKRVVAYAGGMCASAAYWIGAAADEIVVDATAQVGSIGVVAALTDTRERDAKNGVRRYEIVSSQSPHKRLDPGTDAGRARIQSNVDAVAAVFVEAVARYRGTSVETVLAKYGQGDVLVGAAAVEAGLADRLGSLEQVIEALEKTRTDGTRRVTALASAADTTAQRSMQSDDTNGSTHMEITQQLILEKHPDIAEAFRAEGKAAGAAAERARIQAVMAQSMPGCEALIQTLAFDGKTTGPEAAVEVLKHIRAEGASALEALRAGAEKPVEADAKLKKGGTGNAAASVKAEEEEAVIKAGAED